MRKIYWSETAQNDYWDNVDFLQRKWTVKEVQSFMEEVEDALNILKKGSVTFKPTGYKNTFQVTIVKQITLYYHINKNNDIELLRFFNTFQNPEKRSL